MKGARARECFDAEWSFHLGEVAGGERPETDGAGWRRLDLPHDWSIEAEFRRELASSTGYLPGGIGWYRKSFAVRREKQGRRFMVEFDGVYRNSRVWLNGNLLGERPYGYSSFHYDLSGHLVYGGDNVLAVRVEREEAADCRWYPGSGIYRHVWLTETGPVHVAPWGVFVTTPRVTSEKAAVRVKTRIANAAPDGAEIELATSIIGPSGAELAKTSARRRLGPGEEAEFEQETEIARPSLWSAETPVLYRAVTAVISGGRPADDCETVFGIRTIAFEPDRGFLLNGVPTKMRGVCVHHDAGGLGAAVPDRVLERRIANLKALGCNAIRTSHNPMAPEFYDICDRLGLLVMDESFDEWSGGKNKWVVGWTKGEAGRFGYDRHFKEWGVRDVSDMVRRDRNHPCVVLWSVGNEIDYAGDPFTHELNDNHDPALPPASDLVRDAKPLIAAVKGLDTTRPVTVALANVRVSNAVGLADLFDVVGYNYQEKMYEADHSRYPKRVIVGSENGHGLAEWLAVKDSPYVCSQFLWTGIDYLGESHAYPSRGFASGLLDTCGFLKPRGCFREALWLDKPVLHLFACRPGEGRGPDGKREEQHAHWNWEGDARASIPVVAYSNCAQVELFVNGASLGARSPEDGMFRWDVPYQAGELVGVGRNGADGVKAVLATAGDPVGIEAVSDRPSLEAGGIAHVEIYLADDGGRRIAHADRAIEVSVAGAGALISFDNGDQSDMTPMKSGKRSTFRGRALAIVEAGRVKGELTLDVSGSGLKRASVRLKIAGK